MITREVALTETWLDHQAQLAGSSVPAVRIKKEWWIRILTLMMVLAWWAVASGRI